MLCVVYLRRRLVLLGLAGWITTLLFAYSFLAQEAEFRDIPHQLQHIRQVEEPRDHLLLKETISSTKATVVKPVNHIQDQKMVPEQVQYFPINKKSRLEDFKEVMSHGSYKSSTAPSVAEYCNHDNDLSSSQEGNLPTVDYNLLSVHIITRHGDRSPMYAFSRQPNSHLTCQFDPQEIKEDPRLAAYVDTMKNWQGRQKGKTGFHGWALYPGRKVCDTSQLTPAGAKQMLNLGYLLHERYIKKWGLLSTAFSYDKISARSTEYSRTYQSAIALLYAFLPQFNLSSIPLTRSSSYFFCSEQTVSGPCVCPVLMGLKKKADRDLGSSVRNNTRYKDLMSAMAEVYGMARNKLPWMWAMMDVFLTHACNSLPLPCNKNGLCVTSGMVSELWGHVSNYTRQLTDIPKYRQYASLALHPLLSEIVENMKDASNGKTAVKFSLLSGHGSTLIPLSVVLGIDGGNWPQYASRLVMELYSRRDAKQFYIRVLYEGKDVTHDVLFCKGHVSNGLCPFERFVKFVESDNLGQFNDNDYINLCYSPA